MKIFQLNRLVCLAVSTYVTFFSNICFAENYFSMRGGTVDYKNVTNNINESFPNLLDDLGAEVKDQTNGFSMTLGERLNNYLTLAVSFHYLGQYEMIIKNADYQVRSTSTVSGLSGESILHVPVSNIVEPYVKLTYSQFSINEKLSAHFPKEPKFDTEVNEKFNTNANVNFGIGINIYMFPKTSIGLNWERFDIDGKVDYFTVSLSANY